MYTALLIDGGHLRACFKKAGKPYNSENIQSFANNCFRDNETIYRVFYYDAPYFVGEKSKPISGEVKKFENKDSLLSDVAKLENFAVRKGRLKFAGWKLSSGTIHRIQQGTLTEPLTDNNFRPEFSQKGVDMALGLDVAAISETGKVDQFMLVSADTDMAPALKFGRIHGMRAILIKPDYERCFDLHSILIEHSDAVRNIEI